MYLQTWILGTNFHQVGLILYGMVVGTLLANWAVGTLLISFLKKKSIFYLKKYIKGLKKKLEIKKLKSKNLKKHNGIGGTP